MIDKELQAWSLKLQDPTLLTDHRAIPGPPQVVVDRTTRVPVTALPDYLQIRQSQNLQFANNKLQCARETVDPVLALKWIAQGLQMAPDHPELRSEQERRRRQAVPPAVRDAALEQQLLAEDPYPLLSDDTNNKKKKKKKRKKKRQRRDSSSHSSTRTIDSRELLHRKQRYTK